MVYKEDLHVAVTFILLLFISWLVFLRFVNFIEFNLLTLLIFIIIWLASVTVALLHIHTPLLLTFITVSKRLHKNSIHAYTKNIVFICGYISIWLLLGIVFYFAMQFFGYSLSSASIYIVVGYAAIIAGLYKVISLEHINTPKILSPELFFSKNWRDGHKGAYIMGAHHTFHTASSYWVMVIILLLAGYANLLLLGVLSLTIFAERMSSRPVFLSRVAGICFILAGIGILMYSPLLFSLIANNNVVLIAR